MQRIPVAFIVTEQERSGSCLAGRVATLQIFLVRLGIPHVDLHRLIPPIGHRGEGRIQSSPQASNDLWQRIRPVFVLASAETMTIVLRKMSSRSYIAASERHSSRVRTDLTMVQPKLSRVWSAKNEND